ncbi:heavy-metal resistance [Methylobacterium sp. 092160098-2]|jgi:hypothetical protein|uniref:heavy-metal resistance n=1 Tax=Methylobacterium sp. 092160098-2 TaxID=3025129 RepID=UPI001DCFD4A3|nr:heavy-metal resistance [Methylobacterium sp. 092160098-2]MBY0253975.1 heavy-metal resistance [Methylobacterium organophilum]MDE4914656.1 heavy-metal resistance [Methylobacterium sp. 092160098-2]
MSAPTVKTDPFDPFGIAAAMHAWGCLLTAAREIRDVDREMMDTLLESRAPPAAPMSPDAPARVRSLTALMRGLQLDPEAIRQHGPEAMRELEAACLTCAERSRCTRELRAGTAARTYSEFCPNAARLDALHAA